MKTEQQIADEIREHYQAGRGSIQDYARIYNVPVEKVLEIVNEPHLSTVDISGDMIDPKEAGPGAQLNYGTKVDVPYSTN